MLGMMVPFAVVGILRTTGRRRWLYIGAVAALLMGALATQRKTGLVVPAAGLITLTFYRPRAMLRLLPAGAVVVLIVMALSGGAAVGVKSQFVGSNLNSDSTTGRTTDYDATAPDVFRYPLLGRGHGTYDPFKYRFLDNEYLHRTIETGFLGLAAYLALMATAMAVAHRVARLLGPVRGTPGMAAVAGIAAFAVCGAVFDVVSYPQPMYLFLLIAGLCVCLRDGLRT
jgi:O-antigen ligase